MSRKSATELADDLSDIAHEVRRRAAEEVRTELAREIADRFLGRPGQDRSIYGGRHPEDCLLEELADNPALAKVPELRAALERFDSDDREGVTPDFRAGILFAVGLLTDLDFDH
ncbi:hypothetical protein OHB26_39465 (plasmid) [Nocardia sp. NBC_01503]|uniref:hypothetical protein n=1 Tax=Nocardia sp. NBC_01503 TaxID=2975997 RepID=UPI002E7C4CC5|nr:hypothetical protein [Nocardia sp. NBC_01503]WTL36689.1 hypothetical protein OHB26_39110 [Nocardia sp. NBC_01503]WTL36758.1 hypothetical protein OHB26_39465 [Nocardia sp. NBC_01503]